MLADFDHLSIWEIAHRWHDADPNTTDPSSLPLSVQDKLRLITRMQSRRELPVLKPSGIELKNERNFVSFENFVLTNRDEDTSGKVEKPAAEEEPVLAATERKEAYFEALEDWCQKHDEATAGLEKCFNSRFYDKEKLESIHLDRLAIDELCREKSLELPSFWFSQEERANFAKSSIFVPPSEDSHQSAGLALKQKQEQIDRYWSRLTNAQRHRLMAREVAKLLWSQDGDLTQADIIDNATIKHFCGGRYYTDPNTVRNWIKDLDPRPPETRRGPRAKT